MTCLLDTHFLIWVLAKARRLKQFPWLDDYSPWGVSPISLLEIQILSEIGRIKLAGDFATSVMADSRFILDEAPSVTLVQKALDLAWTRDPFDRLIVAHSLVRRLPLCSVDSNIIANHPLVLRDLRI
jgi:PIN domain nuclease of toxin-antitoxin system